MIEEPTPADPGESLETNIAPAALDRHEADRPPDPETEVAPTIIDRDAPAGRSTSNLETCSEPGANEAEDLH